jgi:glycosyltransferase involved in cell wall biosynthesis
MTVIPHLDKNDPAQMTQLSNIYLESHLFLLPTRAEAAGIVFAEASAHGLPSISTHTGGVPTMVLDGVNGLTLPYEATGADYADAIEGVWRDQKAYRELVRSSRKRYDEALNWQAWGRSMNTIISPFIGRAAREG